MKLAAAAPLLAALAALAGGARAEVSIEDLRKVNQCFQDKATDDYDPVCSLPRMEADLGGVPRECCEMGRALVERDGWRKGFGRIRFGEGCERIRIVDISPNKFDIVVRFSQCRVIHV